MAYPAVPECLGTPYRVKGQKGGTLIVEDVTTLEEHHNRLADPSAYRPSVCGNCSGCRLHAHDFRERILRADPDTPVERIRRYLCVVCGAVWQVLPALIARHLHRRWTVVEAATGTRAPSARQPSVPEETVNRWLHRLALDTSQLAQALAGSVAAEVLAKATTRFDLATVLVGSRVLDADRRLEQLAAWVHRCTPGVRVM